MPAALRRSTGEIEDLYVAFDPRYRAMILVGCYAGLRIGEIAGLQKSDIRFLERKIDVKHGLVEVEGRLSIGPLKTKHSIGTVDIPDFFVKELAAHIEAFSPAGELVFTAPEGGLLSPNHWRKRFWRPAVLRSIGEPARPHDMRHSFVSRLIDEGMSIERVCEQARHSDPAFTWSVYRSKFEERNQDIQRAMQALEDVRSKAMSERRTGQIRDDGGTVAQIASAKAST